MIDEPIGSTGKGPERGLCKSLARSVVNDYILDYSATYIHLKRMRLRMKRGIIGAESLAIDEKFALMVTGQMYKEH